MLFARVAGKKVGNEQILPEAMWPGCQEGAPRADLLVSAVAADNKESLVASTMGFWVDFIQWRLMDEWQDMI